MDVLRKTETLEHFHGALHVPKSRPTTVLTPNGSGPIFKDVEEKNERLVNDFARRRGSAMGGDVFAAIPRFYSPVEYFEAQKIPYNMNKEADRFQLYKWLELFYKTHYLIPILIDIFTRFPLVGLELHSPDKDLTSFYEDLFFDRLDYEHFLTDLGREYWTLGESFPLGHFNELLGIWEEEELIDPTMVKIREYPIIGGQQFFLSAEGMSEIRNIVEKGEPKEIAYLLERDYPEWIPFLKNKKDIPVSNVLLKQVAFKPSPRDLHGTPILLRALRTLIHEEKLVAAQDAVAERLYQPLVLVKVGIQDMGQNRGPWVPGPAEVREVRDQFDLALSSDFRLMVHHFGIDVQTVFGREQMPRLDQDFDRIERRLMQCVSGDTLIHTDQGVHPAAELTGRVVNTLSKGGLYRPAEWKNYGKQEIYEIILENGDVLKATRLHRWPTCQANGKHKWAMTEDLAGKRIPIQHYDEFTYDDVEWEEGTKHGLVYGDGWLYINDKYTMIRQYAGNKPLLNVFDNVRDVSVADGRIYTEATKLPARYKTELPFDKSASYIRGFIAGYIAADGCVDDTGHVTLHSKDRESLEQVRKLAITGGIPTIKISSSSSKKMRVTPSGTQMPAGYTMYKLSFVKSGFLAKDGVDERMLLKDSHRSLMWNSGVKRQRYSMKVAVVFNTGTYEDTYCCAESVTHTFVIENNYLTGNTFGINPSLLSGGAASQPYASSALQAEFLNQILRTYQGFLKKHYRDRALIVAEAQQHYAYEKRGDTRIPIEEEVLEYNEEGEPVIVKKKKLLIPELRMKVLDLRDEATQRQFLQALKQQGVPIPDQDIAMGMHYDFDEALARTEEEMIAKTVAQQEAKLKTYNILQAKGLPIPPDLQAEIEGTPVGGAEGPGGPGGPPPGGDDAGSIMMPPPPGGTPAIGPNSPTRGTRPEQSGERSPIPPPGQVPNPTLPGIPGVNGLLGPGTPRPLIPGQNPRPGISSVQDELDNQEPIVIELTRKKAADFKVPSLTDVVLTDDDESATLSDNTK